MSAVGRWKVSLTLPVGTQEMELIVERADGGFSGRVESAMGNFDVAGSADGDRLRWEMKAKKPVPITVNFDVRVVGDAMSGVAKLGMFGNAQLASARIAGEAPAAAGASTADADGDLLTADFIDPMFNTPRIDVDEWRDDPVRHRYVHGGFERTDARFSIYFPPQERCGGRFFHNTYPLITNSDIGPFPIKFDVAVGDLGFTLGSGAYYLQTKLGGADRAPPADPASGTPSTCRGALVGALSSMHGSFPRATPSYRMRCGRGLDHSQNRASEPRMVQHLEQRRPIQVANDMLAQQRDQTLLHQRLGDGLGAKTWLATSASMSSKAASSTGCVEPSSTIGSRRRPNRPRPPPYDAEIAPHTNTISA